MIATHNRRDVLAHTLDQLPRAGLPQHEYETIVVDNASREDVAGVVARHANAVLVRLRRNRGSCAKAFGVDRARGDYILFLDDDSFPRPWMLPRMIARFAADARLGAAGFTVHLPDGAQECSALPHVFVGCGVGFRTAALRGVGGLDRSLFMAAEEYDVSFRLLRAGWRVEVFGDLHVDHLKSPQARRRERITELDVRNNLWLVDRYLPEPYRSVYARDWEERYGWLAERAGHSAAFARGRRAGRRGAAWRRRTWAGQRLDDASLEAVFAWRRVEAAMRRLYDGGVRCVVLADASKNLYTFYRGARMAGLRVLAIADDALAAPGRRYRRVPVAATDDALARGPDAIVVSNTSYVHAARRVAALGARTALPVHSWFPAPATTSSADPTSGRHPVLAALPPATSSPAGAGVSARCEAVGRRGLVEFPVHK
ncbi:MAG: glycosyltransferase family 2 protein [Phycisphaerae bacterium]